MPCDDIAISVRNLTKTYRLFEHSGDRIKQFFSLGLKQYHREFTALKDVSFDIKKGETVGIIGRNGSGKSTLLQLICGILKPTSGTVKINGRVSALLELGAGFSPEFTGRENVYFQAALMGFNKAQIDEKFDDIAAFADIGEFIDQQVRTYSSGMFVRLAFATMIHAEADILIVDEALAVGDEAFQKKCFDKLHSYMENREKVFIFVSHNLRQVERICETTFWLDGGGLRQTGDSRTVCNAYRDWLHTLVRNDLDSDAIRSALSSGEIRVNNVSLHIGNSDQPVFEVYSHCSLRIIIEFLCTCELEQPSILLELQTTDYIPITSTNTDRLPNRTSFPPGLHRIACEFGNLPLTPGVYQFKLVFFDKFRLFLWEAQRICPFRVLADEHQSLIRESVGFLDISTKWILSY